MTNREANRKLVWQCMEYCCQILREGKAVPAEGSFRGYSVSFDFRGSRNQARFCFAHQQGNVRWLRVFVIRQGWDLAVSNYVKKGTNAELAEYLSDQSRVEEFMEMIQHLSDSVDDKLN